MIGKEMNSSFGYEVVLEEKRREIIKGLIKENKICF